MRSTIHPCHCLPLLILAAAASAQTPTYRVDFVGGAPATWSGPTAINAVNDSGRVVGSTYVGTMRLAFVGWPGNGLSLLPLPAGATYAEAFDINTAGTVAGRVLLSGSSSRAVVWQLDPSGNYQALLLPAGPGNQLPFDARGINDAGDVVGKYGILFASYVWRQGLGVTQLTGYPSYPEDINERRQVIGDTYRMDVDTMVIEDLGNPVGTGFNYLFTKLAEINDAGQCGGYGNTASGQSANKQAVRFTDGPVWRAFNSVPTISANVMGIAATGDTAFHLGAGTSGSYLHVDGFGTLGVAALVDPAYAAWNVGSGQAPVISRGGRLATTGSNGTQAGIVVLSPLPFSDLGGGVRGALGTPILTGYGDLRQGGTLRLRGASLEPGALAVLVVSLPSNPVQLLGATVFPDLASAVVLPFVTDNLGRLEQTIALPFATTGMPLHAQAAALDAAAPFGVSVSNGLGGVAQ
ncbi:MAG: hypothetical protein KDC98_18745 [Planctomycetes bacterium]|nr:hypothetical protein [Planctomycetota bacterium]